MPKSQADLSGEMQKFRLELDSLKDDVITLVDRIAILEKKRPEIVGQTERLEQPQNLQRHKYQEKGWAKVGQEVLLPRVAAVCFMMVVALILRTVTENGMIDGQLGLYMGAFYAVGLIGAGCILYRRDDRLAPVFPGCGSLLLFSIIYEANSHFDSLSLVHTYGILLFAEIVVLSIALRCQAVVLLYFAVFASSAVGIVVGFPKPVFPVLALILLANNIAAHLAATRKISRYLRWWTLAITTIFWLLWTYKINFSLGAAANPKEIGLFWSIPILSLFYLFYLFSSLMQTKINANQIGVFHYFMPVINAVGTFLVVFFVVEPWLGGQAAIGQGGVVISGLYIAFVAWLVRDHERAAGGGKEYVTAASGLLIVSLPLAVPAIWAMPIWVAAAAVLTIQSSKWQSGAVRLISYLFQVFIVLFALKSVNYEKSQIPWMLGFILAGIMGSCCLWLYRWCRRHRPDYDSIFFKAVDPADLSAAILLLIGILHLYSMFRFGAFALVEIFFAETPYAFACSKSIIINLGAVALMLIGLRSRVREILLASVPLVVIGAVKVFLFDLFRGQGMPLIISVFSFGVVAVVSSITLKKWGGGRRANG